MLTIAIWSVFLLTFVFSTSAAVAWAARRVGSPRGRLWVGIRAVLLITCINIGIGAATLLIPESGPVSPLVLYGAIFLVQLVLLFVILGRAFRLERGHIAPVGAYFATGTIWVVILMFVVRPRMCESFAMPAESMSPTIQKGDRFFVNKMITPRRWDLVTYWSDSGPDHSAILYCKRLIAFPGERLRFENVQVYINDVVQEPPTVVAGKYHASIGKSRAPYFHYGDGESIQLGETEYFFIGDNVEISADSRMDGPTDRSKLVGVVDCIYWPLSRMAVIR